MATLTLTKAWLNLMATGAAVSAQSMPGRAVDYGMDGGVVTYAGGRQRSITREGIHGQYQITLVLVPRATVDIIRSWMGQTVQLRDDRGRLFVGVYRDVPETERQNLASVYDVPLTLQLVS